jgi:hypothetical protein
MPGYAIGGLSGGEAKESFWPIVKLCGELLPADKPRYLMGVGYAVDLVVCSAFGVDMFDCVYPSRTAVWHRRVVHVHVLTMTALWYCAPPPRKPESAPKVLCFGISAIRVSPRQCPHGAPRTSSPSAARADARPVRDTRGRASTPLSTRKPPRPSSSPYTTCASSWSSCATSAPPLCRCARHCCLLLLA